MKIDEIENILEGVSKHQKEAGKEPWIQNTQKYLTDQMNTLIKNDRIKKQRKIILMQLKRKKWFLTDLEFYNKKYNKNIVMSNVRFAVLPHDKAKAPIYNEHNKIYIDVYAYKDVFNNQKNVFLTN